jgi:hypothetical protein
VTKKVTLLGQPTKPGTISVVPPFPGLFFYAVRVYTPVYPKPGRASALWYFWSLTWTLLQKIRTYPSPSPCIFDQNGQSRPFPC